MSKFRGDNGVPCSVCGRIRYPQPERGIFTVAPRCVDCWRGLQAALRVAKLVEGESAKAKARAAQPSLPGLEPPARSGGLHGSDRGGRR